MIVDPEIEYRMFLAIVLLIQASILNIIFQE